MNSNQRYSTEQYNFASVHLREKKLLLVTCTLESPFERYQIMNLKIMPIGMYNTVHNIFYR